MKRIILLVFTICISMCCAFAAEGTLMLPQALKCLEEQAFYKDTAINNVVLPYGITSIGKQAFAYSGVKQINLPESLTFIAEDAFEGCALEKVEAHGNYALKWCKEHGIKVQQTDPYAGEEDILP